MTVEELAEAANSLLQKKGFNYVFAFDAGICQKIEQVRKKQTNPVTLNAKLKSFENEVTEVTLPEARFEISECGNCFVLMPVLEITGKDFVTIIQNRNIKFSTPPNFVVNEIVLVDNQTLTTKITNWKVPFRATPISISDDGKILFLDLPSDELKDLALIIYAEGTFQFYPKKDLDLTEKGVLLKDVSKDSANPNTSFISFGKDEKKRVLKFNNPCK